MINPTSSSSNPQPPPFPSPRLQLLFVRAPTLMVPQFFADVTPPIHWPTRRRVRFPPSVFRSRTDSARPPCSGPIPFSKTVLCAAVLPPLVGFNNSSAGFLCGWISRGAISSDPLMCSALPLTQCKSCHMAFNVFTYRCTTLPFFISLPHIVQSCRSPRGPPSDLLYALFLILLIFFLRPFKEAPGLL